jgi:hypothetical protein
MSPNPDTREQLPIPMAIPTPDPDPDSHPRWIEVARYFRNSSPCDAPGAHPWRMKVYVLVSQPIIPDMDQLRYPIIYG